MALANWSASSLELKFSPYTCLLSLHWWNVGVAWLYFSPFKMAQFITTCKQMWNNPNQNVLVSINLIVFYLIILQFSTNDTKRLLHCVLEDLDFWESRGRTRWNPLFVNIVVHHHTRPGTGYRLFTITKDSS